MTEEESTPLPVIGQNKDPSPGEGCSEQLHPKALPGQPHVESSLAPKRKERDQGGLSRLFNEIRDPTEATQGQPSETSAPAIPCGRDHRLAGGSTSSGTLCPVRNRSN